MDNEEPHNDIKDRNLLRKSKSEGAATSRPMNKRTITDGINLRKKETAPLTSAKADVTPVGMLNVTLAQNGRINLDISDMDLGDAFAKDEEDEDLSLHKIKYNRDGEENYGDFLTDEFTHPSSSLQTRPSLSTVDKVPRLNIVIHIVGTRGDVQPFLALSLELKNYGHNVRFATHEKFRSFVQDQGLEFYPLAGDPDELMAFMVKNGGLIPTIDAMRDGSVTSSRKTIKEILSSTYKSCIDPSPNGKPFKAEAIIANPPSYGHLCCAEALHIPLHLMFTMPWTQTESFPHPLANIRAEGVPPQLTGRINFLSYRTIDALQWTGLSGLINSFRRKELLLPSWDASVGTSVLTDQKVPFNYCWSRSLIPKPKDWGSEIDISGFFTLQLENAYTPDPDLLEFLNKEPKPVYIGFGSITGHDPEKFAEIIYGAIEHSPHRFVIGSLGKVDRKELPNVYNIGNVPHDFLFKHVSAVCHHGGAGTTCAGLMMGRPTIIIPFFGDQPFWGAMVHRRNAGPSPIPWRNLTSERLKSAIDFCFQEDVRLAAEKIAAGMRSEDGARNGLLNFHKQLPVPDMVSAFENTWPASLHIPSLGINVSLPVAQVLISMGVLMKTQFVRHHLKDWNISTDGVVVPMYGLIAGTSKGIKSIVSQSGKGFEKAKSTDSPAKKARRALRGIGLGFGGFLYYTDKGVLSMYGEVTDILEKLPCLWDLFHKNYGRPKVDNFRQGLDAALYSTIRGFWGMTDLLFRPYQAVVYFGYHTPVFGLDALIYGILVGVLNFCIKPPSGVAAAITWAARGSGRSIETKIRRSVRPDVDRIEFGLDDLEEARGSRVEYASRKSGYTPAQCQSILEAFISMRDSPYVQRDMSKKQNVGKKVLKYLRGSIAT